MTEPTTILPANNILGILGGGQIGRMTAQIALTMGYQVAIFDPDPNSPAAALAQHHLQADYHDSQALAEFSLLCAAATTEFENVPAQALALLQSHCQVSPPASSLTMAQHRGLEKQFFQQHGINCAPFHLINSAADISSAAAELFPAILKTSQLGYDGKGQIRLQHSDQLTQAWQQLGQVPCILEKMLPLAAEYSVVVARGFDGQLVNLPIQRNQHHQGILAITEVDTALLPRDLSDELINNAKQIANQLNYVGVLCVEFFLLTDGRIFANEIAPRPHNSGHHSIDSCDYSQFELQVRTMAKLPLTQPRLHSPCVMLNLLGDLWFKADATSAQSPAWDQLLALPGVHLHLYGKKEARPGRKMGHITITAADLTTAQNSARQVAALLQLELTV